VKSPKAPTDAKGIVITIKGSPEWRDWVNRGSDAPRLSAERMVDVAAIEW
jgi:hypothetical protein